MLQGRELNATSEGPQSQPVDLEVIREELEALRLRLSAAAESSMSKVVQDKVAETRLVYEILKSRRRRDLVFGENLFGEPAWDLLLGLYLAQEQQRRTSISAACIASASPQTTGLRWIRLLEEQGWVAREPDPLDGRRMWVTLTDRASEAMHGYLEQLAVQAA